MGKTQSTERYFCYIPSPDSWYPNYEDGTVRVGFDSKNNYFKVSVWGADDFGLEKEFTTRLEAIELYRKLSKCSIITIKQLKELGFING